MVEKLEKVTQLVRRASRNQFCMNRNCNVLTFFESMYRGEGMVQNFFKD
jgi:hypothetical protein